MHKLSPTLLVATVALASGCATPPPAPPPEFSFHRVTIVASSAESPVVLDGAPGKSKSAAVGAVGGGAIALALGGVACLATGPFVGPCFGMLAPTVAVTAAGTAVTAAVISDTAQDVEAKRNLLRAAMSAPAAHVRLAAKVLAQARAATGAALAPATAEASDGRRDWTLRLTVTQFETVGTGADVPYALQASADLEVMRSGAEKPAFIKRYQAVSATKHTIAEWGASAGEPVRTALDGLLTKIASDMVAELMKREPQRTSLFNIRTTALAFADGR